MPLYELFVVSKAYPMARLSNEQNTMANIVSIINSTDNSVIKRIEYLGCNELAHRMKAHTDKSIYEYRGNQWTIQFYASTKGQDKIYSRLWYEDAVLRHGIIKLGDSLKSYTQQI